jgi:hypothetical protein
LTDGSWESEKGHCFATGEDDRFPKHVTIDLGQPYRLTKIRLGVPEFGSTRSVEVAIGSERWNGKWKTVGTHDFATKKADRWTADFPPVSGRFVRITFKRNHPETVGGYAKDECFLTEAEVYGVR